MGDNWLSRDRPPAGIDRLVFSFLCVLLFASNPFVMFATLPLPLNEICAILVSLKIIQAVVRSRPLE